MDQIITQTQKNMEQAFEVLRRDFATIKTGKASPGIVENIIISAYGGQARMRLNELATIHAVDAQTLAITPFDQSVAGEIRRGIEDANLGLNPILDAGVLRINLPPLTEERRKEYVKLASQKAESGKVMIRQVRHEAMEGIKKMKNEDSVSEDDITRLEKEVQKVTDEYMGKIDQLKAEKEKELMSL